MKSWHLTMGAGLSGLVQREHAVPEPGPGEVLLRVRAASLNYRELMILQQGRYPLPVKPDVIGLCYGACEVIALGAGATRVAPGERVIASIFPHWIDGAFSFERAAQLGGSLDGMLTEYAVLPEAALVAVPPHLSDEEAAALPCAGVTAWNALSGGAAPLQSGDDVLVLGSGGVALAALQLAKAAGARVIATTSSAAKAERLRELGADAVIDHVATPQWSAEVRRLTGGAGVRHVIETGGSTLAQSLKAVALGGEIAFVGTLGGAAATLDAGAVFAAGATLRPIAAGSRTQLAAVARTVAVNRLRPPIDRVFGFDDAPAAFAHYARGGNLGKIVIRVAS